jgi:hypothetical protein
MNEDKPAKSRHTFNLTITHDLYKAMKKENSLKKVVEPGSVSHGVIGKLIETIDKKYQSVELNHKGE